MGGGREKGREGGLDDGLRGYGGKRARGIRGELNFILRKCLFLWEMRLRGIGVIEVKNKHTQASAR